MQDLGVLGLWLGGLTLRPYAELREVVRAAEDLGFGTVWVNEAFGREAFTSAALVLGETERVVVATGVANLWVRDPIAMGNAARTLGEAYPGRFLLGLGASHRELVDRRGHDYAHPLEATRRYLEDMAAAPYRAAPPPEPVRTVLGALGPRMLTLAAERCDGAHPYLVPVEHTAEARGILGPGPLLIPEQAVVLTHDVGAARGAARAHLRTYRGLDNYRRSLERLGWGPNALEDGGSDELVDALVAWGDAGAVADRVAAHRAAGADQVALQVLTGDGELPTRQLAELASAILR